MKSHFNRIRFCFAFSLVIQKKRKPFVPNSKLIFYRHRVCNIFARTYYELWLQDENIGQEIMIEDLTVRLI